MSKRLRPWAAPAAIALVALAATAAPADMIISTIDGTGPGVTGPAWDGTNSISTWGTVAPGSHTPSYGQSFIDPAGNPFLQSMTFEIWNTSGADIPFQAYVYQWTGSTVTGPALFTSDPMAVHSAIGFQAITVAAPETQLVPGNQYVAFFSTIGEGGPSTAGSNWGYMQTPPGGNAYNGGTFMFSNDTSFPPATWSPSGNSSDLAFSLSFTTGAASVPEPSPAVLAAEAAALVGVSALIRRRRFRKARPNPVA